MSDTTATPAQPLRGVLYAKERYAKFAAAERAKEAAEAETPAPVDNRLVDTHLDGVKLLPVNDADSSALTAYAVIRGGVDIGTIRQYGTFTEVLAGFSWSDSYTLPEAVDKAVEMRDRWEA